MSALGVLVIVTFGLVFIQQLVLVSCAHADEDGALAATTIFSVPIALLVTAAFIVALVQSCDPAEPVLAPVAAESQAR